MGVGVARTEYDLVGIGVGLSEFSPAADVAVEVSSRSSLGLGVDVGGKVIELPSQ